MKRLTRILASFALAWSAVFGQNAQTSEIVPGENLVVEGIPKIPASLAEAIGPYRSGYGYPLAGWNPSKRELWLKILASTGTWVSSLNEPGGIARPSISIADGGVYDVYFQPQGKYLIYNKDLAGNESFQLYLYDIAARTKKVLTDGKSRNTEPVWSNAGERIIYSSSPPNGNGVDLSVMNPLDPGTARVIGEGKGHYLKAYDWSPDDRKAVVCEYISNTVSTVWLVDVMSGEKVSLIPSAEPSCAYYDLPQFSRDGKGVYLITDRDSEFRRLAYVDLATKQYRYLSGEIKWDVEDFRLAPDGKTLAFVTNDDGISKLHLLNCASGQQILAASMPPGIISDLHWHNNAVDLAFNFKSSTTPNDVYSVDAKTGKVERWSKGLTGQINAEKLPKPELIHWKSLDGRLISGFLYRPTSPFGGRRPVIIDIHGGPEDQYRPRFGYNDNYFINGLGVVKIFPNVRGSTGYGKAFVNLDNGPLRVNAVKDIGALLDWIKGQPDLDPDRVMVQGASYGGYMALAVAGEYSDRIRAALSDSGPSDLVTFVEKTAGWRRDIQRQEFGDERDARMRTALKKLSPLNNVRRINKPLMVVQGENDVRVPADESRLLVSALKRRGVAVWYLLAKGEGHDWSNRKDLDFQLYSTVLFVQEYLLK
jgi:dipeptidyl aminopeptidase/acylaminoacyl peptidase